MTTDLSASQKNPHFYRTGRRILMTFLLAVDRRTLKNADDKVNFKCSERDKNTFENKVKNFQD